MSVYLYLPDDEDDNTPQYGGVPYTLKANSATQVPSVEVAAHIVSTHGKWGVCIVGGPVTNGKASRPEDQSAVDAAEKRYEASTREWAEGLLLDYWKRNESYRQAGLKSPDYSDDESKAFEWLRKRSLVAA